jgi:hypothetical protein
MTELLMHSLGTALAVETPTGPEPYSGIDFPQASAHQNLINIVVDFRLNEFNRGYFR